LRTPGPTRVAADSPARRGAAPSDLSSPVGTWALARGLAPIPRPRNGGPLRWCPARTFQETAFARGETGPVDTLLERERELAAVQQFIERGVGVLLIEGRAGIGKTSLLQVASRRAQKLECDILPARGSELEAGFAFGVVRQLFERRLASAGMEEREALLAGPALAARRPRPRIALFWGDLDDHQCTAAGNQKGAGQVRSAATPRSNPTRRCSPARPHGTRPRPVPPPAHRAAPAPGHGVQPLVTSHMY
jgi:hypothetical protein